MVTTTGNLSWRQNNNVTNLKEAFNYDNLDRLDNVYQGVSNPTMTLDMDYYANKGGITTKSDVGTLLYSLTSKPYAVSHIAPVTSIVPTALDSLTYTSFESVSTIEEGIYTASFVYNPEDQRAKMEVKQNGSVLLTRWYLGSNYIKETSSGVTKEYTFIGGDAYSAPVVAIKQSGTTTFYYLLRDHLGSITHVVNSSTGSTVYEYSYDAWGRMRNTSTWTDYAPGSEPVLSIAGRGFTGHEHLPWFNMINMNGRIYDPLIGQFLSPDNNVQSPDLTQNFNRYSYCLNNPLKYTDINGYTWGIFKPFVRAAKWVANEIIKPVVNLGINVVVDVAAITIGIPLSTLVTAGTIVLGVGDGIFEGDWSTLKNGAKIVGGLFTGSGRQILSRFTKELPQTIVGYLVSQFSNMIDDVQSVSYYDGATVVQHWSGSWGGITLGSFINGDNSIEANPNNDLFQHEFGHYLQSQNVGLTYLAGIAIPNAIDAATNDYWGHTKLWSEQDANIRAINYFLCKDKNYNGWDWQHNPIYDKNGNPIYDYKRNWGRRGMR